MLCKLFPGAEENNARNAKLRRIRESFTKIPEATSYQLQVTSYKLDTN